MKAKWKGTVMLGVEFALCVLAAAWSLRYGWMAFWLSLALSVVFGVGIYLCEIRYLSAALANLRRNGNRADEAREFLEVEGDLIFAQSFALAFDTRAMATWLERLDPDAPPPERANDIAIALVELSEDMRSQRLDLAARGQAVLDSLHAGNVEAQAILSRRVSQRVKRRVLQPGVAGSLTSTAVRIAGGRHAHLHEPWMADLFGAPEEGLTVTPKERLALALGFVVAGLRLRLRDLAAPFWRPVDWLLSVDSRLNAFVTAAVGSAAVYFDVTEGLHVLLVERSEPCAILGGTLYGVARSIRKRRGIEVETRRAGHSRP